jgi:RNA polymerase sigma factor (sigma-70 family)
MIDKEEFARQNINMAQALAWSFHHSTGLEQEELFGEASVAFAEALHSYQEGNGTQLSTWVWACMRNHLINYCRKERKHHTTPKLDPDAHEYLKDDSVEIRQSREDLLSMLSNLSIQAQEVIQITLDAPLELYQSTPKKNRGALRDYLRRQGWKWRDIWDSFREIRQNMTQL